MKKQPYTFQNVNKIQSHILGKNNQTIPVCVFDRCKAMGDD